MLTMAAWLNLVHWTNNDHLAHLESFTLKSNFHVSQSSTKSFSGHLLIYQHIKSSIFLFVWVWSIPPLFLNPSLQGQLLIFSHEVSQPFARLLFFNRHVEEKGGGTKRGPHGFQKGDHMGVHKGDAQILYRPVCERQGSKTYNTVNSL